MPIKSSQKVHLTNIIKVVVGDIANRKKQRRRRRRPTSSSKGEAVNRSRQLIQELQTLSSRVNNVSNPQASNSATLLSKINEVETNNKIKSLENQLHHIHNNIPRLPPSTTQERGLLDYKPVNTGSLIDIANGFEYDKERFDRVFKHLPLHSSSFGGSSSRPLIEEVPSSPPRIQNLPTTTTPSPIKRSSSETDLTALNQQLQQKRVAREKELKEMKIDPLRTFGSSVLGSDVARPNRKWLTKPVMIEKILQKEFPS